MMRRPGMLPLVLRAKGGGSWGVLHSFSATTFGNDASLKDLGSAGKIFQVEGWYKRSDLVLLLSKGGTPALGGWYIDTNGAVLAFTVQLSITPMSVFIPNVTNNVWHHYVASYNDTTKQGYVALDGTWSARVTGEGNYVTDLNNVLTAGRRSDGAFDWFLGTLRWQAIHNHLHYTPEVNFTPPLLFTPDAGVVEYWMFDEGSGVTVAAHVNTPANDGTTNGTWTRL